MIAQTMQVALWSRRFLLATTALFVLGVLLGSLIGTEGFLLGAVVWLPLWLWCLALSFVTLWQASNSAMGRRTRRTALETLGALAIMLVAEIGIALLTNMLSIKIGS